MARFDRKVAIVTGAGSGIGRATARLLAAEGAAVTVADIDGAAAVAVAEEIGRDGGRVRHQLVDVSDDDSVRAMVADTVAEAGRLDVLHNNAAVIALNFEDQDVATMDLATWDRVFAVNLRGAMLGCRHALPVMARQGSGVIVNTASAAAFYGGDLMAYGASKAALVSLTQSVASSYGSQGIRCNAVAPGIVVEPSLQEQVGGPTGEALVRLTAGHVVDHLGEPEDVAAAVAFLASDDARFITGETFRVDGGFTAHGPTYALKHLDRLTGAD